MPHSRLEHRHTNADSGTFFLHSAHRFVVDSCKGLRLLLLLLLLLSMMPTRRDFFVMTKNEIIMRSQPAPRSQRCYLIACRGALCAAQAN